jgi:hypothetical protein
VSDAICLFSLSPETGKRSRPNDCVVVETVHVVQNPSNAKRNKNLRTMSENFLHP